MHRKNKKRTDTEEIALNQRACKKDAYRVLKKDVHRKNKKRTDTDEIAFTQRACKKDTYIGLKLRQTQKIEKGQMQRK